MLVEDVANLVREKLSLTKKASREAVHAVFDAVGEILQSGHDVKVRNFGKFWIKVLPAKVGLNPATGERINLPERYKVKFKPITKLHPAKKG